MVKLTKGEQSKNRIIECAANLFIVKGYNATGVNDILELTKLPKGSFYFHFASKKALAIEVSKYFDEKINGWVENLSKKKDWKEFIESLLNEMIRGAEVDKHFGCPFAVLGLEIAFSEPDISEYYLEAMKKLIDNFKNIFIFSGLDAFRADDLANKAFSIYEGYLVYYRISKDIDVLKKMKTDLKELY
ncbi:TetR/AcrR family transcriptional regulator [Clostridium sp. YIM B02506]|uniref:TetR/AcrR family transcriptional regulator n=1 Tax=Clostridium sp. YIM B02506 TaxID=2910680 RepID=UPI001EEF6B08|nr:TetR/AcrR family transcriptional regulator [Clostridium sp. YIM B02506]